ncbi:MAG: hypothetical protein JWO03_1147 [Bacteroidetes bacterium]|nr:hypothetical protein [Bacteroidota bacterium]
MKKYLHLFLLLCIGCTVKAQTQTFAVHSGPYSQFHVFRGSGNQAGASWTTASYNDASWLAPVNGSVPDTSAGTSSCDGPNWSPWHSGDTAIWSNVTSAPPDTGCFRKVLRFCGTATSASFHITADDYHTVYINGHLLGIQPQASSGVIYTLTPTQLAWFVPGDNVIAIEATNSTPFCASMSMYGSVTVDTVGCVYTGISSIDAKNVDVSPMPVKNLLRVSLPASGAAYTISIYDAIGHKLAEQMTTEAQTVMDLGHLSKGIYLLQVSDAENHTITKRIAKD